MDIRHILADTSLLVFCRFPTNNPAINFFLHKDNLTAYCCDDEINT